MNEKAKMNIKLLNKMHCHSTFHMLYRAILKGVDSGNNTYAALFTKTLSGHKSSESVCKKVFKSPKLLMGMVSIMVTEKHIGNNKRWSLE